MAEGAFAAFIVKLMNDSFFQISGGKDGREVMMLVFQITNVPEFVHARNGANMF